MWAAAEVSYKQLEVDAKQLESQIDRIRMELNNGVPKVREEKGEAVAGPLNARLTRFLALAEPRLIAIKRVQGDVSNALLAVMSKYEQINIQ